MEDEIKSAWIFKSTIPTKVFTASYIHQKVRCVLTALLDMNFSYSALALVVSKIKVGTTGNPIGPRPKFSLKTSSYMSGELRECFNFKNIFAKNCRNLDFSAKVDICSIKT